MAIRNIVSFNETMLVGGNEFSHNDAPLLKYERVGIFEKLVLTYLCD